MNRFQKLVAEAKKNIAEISPAEAQAQADTGDAVLIDVRDEEDWREDHAKGAKHLERGVIELEIEEQVPDLKTPIICYCGGGSRVLWFIDCCYSGQAGLVITKQSKGPAYAAVTSSAASESSTEHWTFTEALLDAFRGVSYVDLNHDGAVTLSEFAAHVEADMNAAEEQRSTFAHTKGFDADMIVAQAKPLPNPRIGERAKARDSDGDWYACRIIDARNEKLRIHFIGYEDDEDLWVAPEDLKPIQPVRYAKGATIEVLWKKRWYPATVLQAKDGVHLIHYTNYDSKWDEWVPSRRIREPKS